MNRVQVVLSVFSKRVFCFVQAKTLCGYGCMYLLAALVLVCVDVIVMLLNSIILLLFLLILNPQSFAMFDTLFSLL